MPLVPPRPLRPRKTIRGCRSLSRSASRRSVVPLQRPLLLNMPSKLTRSIAGEGAGGGGQGVRGWQLHCRKSSPPTVPFIISEMVLFPKQRRGSGVRRGCGGGGRGPPPRAGHRTLRGAERGSGAIPAIPGEAARIHSVRPALRLAPSLALLNNISLVGGLGFIIIIVIIILSVIFVVAAAAAAPVNLSPSLRLFDLSLALCWLERCVLFCLGFFVLFGFLVFVFCFSFFTRLMFLLGSAVKGLGEAACSSLIFSDLLLLIFPPCKITTLWHFLLKLLYRS